MVFRGSVEPSAMPLDLNPKYVLKELQIHYKRNRVVLRIKRNPFWNPPQKEFLYRISFAKDYNRIRFVKGYNRIPFVKEYNRIPFEKLENQKT